MLPLEALHPVLGKPLALRSIRAWEGLLGGLRRANMIGKPRTAVMASQEPLKNSPHSKSSTALAPLRHWQKWGIRATIVRRTDVPAMNRLSPVATSAAPRPKLSF